MKEDQKLLLVNGYHCRVDLAPAGYTGWLAVFPDLHGAYGFGDTREDAIEKAREACQKWLDVAKAIGVKVPPPVLLN